MQRSSQLLVLIASAFLAGCTQASKSVFVDLNEVLKEDQPTTMGIASPPKPPPTRPLLVETVPGAPAVALPDPANGPKQNVQKMFLNEQSKAFAELQRRLTQLYSSEIQSFRLQEEQSIAGEEQAAYETANAKIRPLFESWAAERAPKYARLAVLAGFPDPNPDSKPTDATESKLVQRRAEEAKQLRIDLKRIDAQFQTASKTLLAGLLAKSSADQAALRLKVDAFAAQMDTRAQDEARAQIRQAASHLTFKLAEPNPVNMPATQARHLTIPAEAPLESAPEVPSGGILDGPADRRRLLEHQLKIWLAVNHFTLSPSLKGHRNATQEFQIWRQHHGAGL